VSINPDLPAILGGTPVFSEGPPVWPRTTEAIRNAITAALHDGTWGHYHGPRGCELEAELADQFGVPHAMLCASGTLAVEVGLRSVGVGADDEVILAAYEYESNFLTIHSLGAKPVLVDVSQKNWNLAPSQLAAAISSKTKAVLASHLHGGVIPMPELLAVAESHKIPVIEDIAQCPGATIGTQFLGTFGRVGTLSFGGSKLVSAGRGGAILFRDSRAFQRAKVWLTRGVQPWATLSELQALVLGPQLRELVNDTLRRRRFVDRLRQRLVEQQVPGLHAFENRTDALPGYYKLGFRYSPTDFGLSRELLVRAMRAEGVAFDEGFRALHLGRSSSRYRVSGELPEAENASEHCVKLHHPVLLEGNEGADQVARALQKVYRNSERIRQSCTPS
jgi:perosamine synthetase